MAEEASGTVTPAAPAAPAAESPPAAAAPAAAPATPAPAATPPAAAIEYKDFAVPEGTVLDPKVATTFKAIAREFNLTQEAAQAFITKLAPEIAQGEIARTKAAAEKIVADKVAADSAAWVAQAKADPEIGGDKLAENMAVAKKTFDAFGSPALRTFLEERGLADHPELLKWAFRIGKLIGPDNQFVSGATVPNNAKPIEDRLWPDKQA